MSLNYFGALVAIGSFVLLSALNMPISMVLGNNDAGRAAMVFVNSALAIVWAVFLVMFWVRNRGLAPKAAKPGRKGALFFGHLLVLAGHAVVVSLFMIKDAGLLMILPVVVILFLYALGIVLVEAARDRSAGEFKPWKPPINADKRG